METTTISITNENPAFDTSSERAANMVDYSTNWSLQLRQESWTIPLIALSAFNILLIAVFEVFVLYKASKTCPSRRHLFLGQMLLISLFISSLVGLAFVPVPTLTTCTVIRLGLGISYSLIFSTLLVKAVFLLSLHSGVYLSAVYQALLLFFINATQIAIDVQWLIHHLPQISVVDGYARCSDGFSTILLSLVYDIFLIFMVTFLAFRARGYRENHSEAMFIAIGIVLTIILWFIWIIGGIISNLSDRDGFLAFGVVVNANIIFFIMFVPKGRQLAAMGRVVPSDGREGISTPSSPSVYTPSFIHIKPTNYQFTKSSMNFYKQFGDTNTLSGNRLDCIKPVEPLNGKASFFTFA